MRELRLGRIPVFDPRSREFPVRKLFTGGELPISKTWYTPLQLDQGNTSGCVGFSFAHFLCAFPDPTIGVTAEHATRIYKRAQRLDDIPGEGDGTSVLAGIKAVRRLFPTTVDTYHWATGIDDLILTLGHVGPVVLGLNWYSSCYEPDSCGVIKVGGVVTGGHAIVAVGVDLLTSRITLHQSWGSNWGLNGQCFISFEDMERLLREQGEACVPTGKHAVTI